MLDLACGAGRYTRILHERGAHVVGLDLSVVLLAEARRQGVAAPLVLAQLAHVGMSFIATVMVGRLGTGALAALLVTTRRRAFA